MLVELVHPEKATAMGHLRLPGQTTSYTDSAILAQTSGYLRKWYFDIGAQVKPGDVLAEIGMAQLVAFYVPQSQWNPYYGFAVSSFTQSGNNGSPV